jgi:hypothetical protein
MIGETAIPGAIFGPLLLAAMLAFGFLSPFWLCLLILGLRKTHPQHIYVIWFVFSLSFVAFFFLYLVAAHYQVKPEELFGEWAKGILVTVFSFMRDGEAEIKLVLAFVGIVVLPQALTYLLSGLSGSASPPVFVSQTADLATWSLVKFSAGLAGILLADWLVDWIIGGSHHLPPQFFAVTVLLEIAFFLVWINQVARKGVDRLRQVNSLSSLRFIDDFFTRFSRHGTEASSDPDVEPEKVGETRLGPSVRG